MSELGKYLRQAKASKAAGFSLPVIASAEDAVRVVREAGAQLAHLPSAQRLALLSDLKELSVLLADQMSYLDHEMSGIRERLSQARSSRLACYSYARSAVGAGASIRRH
jgi:hypothetical protein